MNELRRPSFWRELRWLRAVCYLTACLILGMDTGNSLRSFILHPEAGWQSSLENWLVDPQFYLGELFAYGLIAFTAIASASWMRFNRVASALVGVVAAITFWCVMYALYYDVLQWTCAFCEGVNDSIEDGFYVVCTCPPPFAVLASVIGASWLISATILLVARVSDLARNRNRE